jgi:hypothetical protein
MAHFPTTPSFTGFNTPSRIEADILDLAHEGAIPRELNGAFFRVQPDPQFPPRLGDDISFNGDGMISRFHIHDGRCDFRQRWARTDKWQLEHAAGRALFGAYRNPLTDDEAVRGKIRGTANTNAWLYGGKLYALKEDSPALVMNAATLETEGYTSFNGRMTGQTFTAHPKVDPKTGNMIAFGYAASGLCSDDCTFYEITPRGELIRELWFKAPYYCMMHDFAITADYALFHIVPSIGSWERLRQGLPHFGFDTTLPVYLGILPRRRQRAGHPLVQARQLLRQPRPQRLPGRHQDPLRHPGGEEQHVPVLPRRARRALQRRRGHELPDALDGGHEFKCAGLCQHRAPHRHRRRVSAHRQPLRRPAVPARVALGDGHAPAGGAARRQRRGPAHELPLPQGSRHRRRRALVVRTGVEPAGGLLHTAPPGGRRG